MPPKPLQIYGFWRSQATYRLRVALNLKGIPYTETPINLDAGDQHSAEFLKLNSLGSVPALVIDGQEPLTQSLAILEYLEETYPGRTPLLPPDALGRARVRSLASIAISDSHPLIVPRVRTYLQEKAGFSSEQWKEWQTKWFVTALRGFEDRLSGDETTGKYCHGDDVTWADICLSGLLQGARAFEIVVPELPTVERIASACEAMDAFEKAKAVHQLDYPKRSG